MLSSKGGITTHTQFRFNFFKVQSFLVKFKPHTNLICTDLSNLDNVRWILFKHI